MRKLHVRLSVALALTAVLAAGCADIMSPVAVLHDDGNAAAFISEQDEHGAKAYAHAIHVRISATVLNTTIADEYSFKAMEHQDDVKGHFQFFQRRIIEGVEQAVVIASGPIVCLQVIGNRAKVGGRVESTTFPEGIPIGTEITWSVTDNGKSANADDGASQPLGNDARAYCQLGLPYPEVLVARGKVQIRD